MKTSRLLVVILVLQGLLLLGQWTGQGPVTPAHAQIPDSGAQRQQMLDELKSMNAKMDKLIGILESGQVQVSIAMPDEKKKEAP